MTTTIILGLLIGTVLLMVKKSFYMPKARTVQAIMLLGKLYTFIENIEGKTIYKGEDILGGFQKWDIIDLIPGEKKRWNIYFFLWPFFTLHTYPLTYTKEKMIGEQQDGDVMIWEDKETKHCLISRTGISNHLEWRVEYPTVTSNLDTEELAAVNTYTNNMLELTNPAKALFGIKNWLEAANEILHGGLRGLVAKKPLHDLNQYSCEEKDNFDSEMKRHANDSVDQPGLLTFGFELLRSIFKDFNPANDKSRELMASFANVTIAEETGKARVKAAEQDVKVAEQKAKAYEAEQEPIVKWRKKYLVDTGLAKVDAQGNITELVPDANAKITAEAMKEWAKVSTLVVDSGTINKIFTIKPTEKENV